jgi:hypothetical protein
MDALVDRQGSLENRILDMQCAAPSDLTIKLAIYDAYKSDDPGMHAQEIISALSRYFEQSVTPPFNGEKIAA